METEKIIECPFEPRHIDVPNTDFISTLFAGFGKNPHAVAFEDLSTGQKITFKELQKRSETLARHLLSIGCRTGDIVGIMSPSSIETIIFMVAAYRIGAVTVIIEFWDTADEIMHLVTASGPKYLYTTEDIVPVVSDVLKQISCQVIVNDSSDTFISVRDLLEKKDGLPILPEIADLGIKADDPAAMCFSGGTTGRPKPAVSSHYNLNAMHAVYGFSPGGIPSKELVGSAICEIPGWISAVFGICYGTTTFFMSEFDFREMIKCIQDHKLRRLLIPIQYAQLFSTNFELDEYSLTDLQVIVIIGATLGVELRNQLFARLPGIAIMQDYGLSESGPVLSPPLDEKSISKCGTVGVPLPNTKFKVVDTDSGVSLGPGKRGDIWFQAPTVGRYYKSDQKTTAELVDKDGWLHSGDIGYYDEDGYFYIVDRLREMIRISSLEHMHFYWMSPVEMETILMSHPAVADAGVVGLPDPSVGETPAAAVVRKPGATVTEDELDKYVTEKVSSMRSLRGGIRFVDSLPKNSFGKVCRRKLKEAFLSGKI